MDDKRKAKRWHPEEEKKSELVLAGVKEEVKVLDVSTGGMRVLTNNPSLIGLDFEATIKIHPKIGPFLIWGKIVRVERSGEHWATALEFTRVRAIPT